MLDFAQRGSMATQTVLPAPIDVGYARDPEPAAVRASAPLSGPSTSRSLTDLQPILAAFGFFAMAVTLVVFIHRFRTVLFQLAFYALFALASSAIKYLRAVHPALLPTVLEPASPLRLRQRIKTILAWTFFVAIFGGVVMLIAASFSASCSCEDHPALFVLWLSTLLSSGLGYMGIAGYLGLRSAPPLAGSRSGSWPAMRRPVSEYKPFVSDHWGQPAQH
jgi:hypothetical protein